MEKLCLSWKSHGKIFETGIRNPENKFSFHSENNYRIFLTCRNKPKHFFAWENKCIFSFVLGKQILIFFRNQTKDLLRKS